MTTDHSAFIIKHHHVPEAREEAKDDNNGFVILALVMLFLYVIFCLAGYFIFDAELKALGFSAVIFAVASVPAFFIFRFFNLRAAHQRRKELLLEVLEGSRGARLITDASDNAVYANQKFRKLCEGVGEASLSSLSRLFEKDEETLAHFRMLADKAFRGLTDSIELLSLHGDQENWYQVTAQPIAGWAGYVHWRIDDISEKRSLDKAIRDEREKLIDFTDNAPVGFFSVDENGRFLFVNATLARWLGEDIGTILKTGYLHTYFVNVPEGARPYDIVVGGGSKQIAEVVMKGHGGRTFSASISQAVVDEGNGLVRTRGVLHDLTAEREMYQALKASEDRFEQFFKEAPLGIVIINEKGAVNDCNASFAEMMGFSIDDMTGRHLEAIIHEDDRKRGTEVLDMLNQDVQYIAPMELTLNGHDNEVVVQMFARRLEGGKNLMLHFIDLSQQKALEAQFVQSQKMQAIGQLAGGVAHDFNNLLTAMIGFCDLLLLRHKPGDPSFADIMQIKQNSNRASNLVRQLLAFSRQQTLRPRVHDITDILSEVTHLLRRLIGANIELDLVHGQELDLVKVDVGQMEQVLVNLAVNARDAMENGGHLTITTSNFENKKPVKCISDEMPAGQWVSIAVKDEGHGIDPDNIVRIFEPFFTTKDVGQGTGLGLATVYGIIRQTGGYLDVTSELGKGTTFTIYLPAVAESEAQNEIKTKEPEETADLTGTARVLLVEDEDAVRKFSSRALANKGYEVLDAASAEDALELLESEDVDSLDLLITDVIMPDMDGPTLAGKIREKSESLKIIFISGYTEEKLKDHMGENIWFLAKPFTLKQLASKVKEVLDT